MPSVGLHRRTEFLGLLALLAPMLALSIWRNAQECSIWGDENYSLMLAHHKPADLVELTMYHQHPPGYYMALKGWLHLARSVGREPGVLWARSLGICGWLAMILGAWWFGRRLVGATWGLLLAWSLGLAAMPTLAAHNMRGYALALPALFLCFMLLLDWSANLRIKPMARGRGVLYGLFYVALAEIALWSHLLGAIVLALLGLVWLGLIFTHRNRRAELLISGIIVHILILLLYLPWLLVVNQNLGTLEGRRWWTTLPTLANLFRVFVGWYPLGQMAARPENALPKWLSLTIGTLSVLPLAGLGIWLWRRNTPCKLSLTPLWLGFLGVAVAVGNVLVLWLLDYYSIKHVFHGPRYTMFTAPFWAMGLAGLAYGAVVRMNLAPVWSWLAMAPWFVCGILGQYLDMCSEFQYRPGNVTIDPDAVVPARGAPVYVMPSELMPFYRNVLGMYDARPIEALTMLAPNIEEASILHVNPWWAAERIREKIFLSNLQAGRIADAAESHALPRGLVGRMQFTYWRLRGIHPETFAALLSHPVESKRIAVPPRESAVAAFPDELHVKNGWHMVEVDADGIARRWTRRETAAIHLNKPLVTGPYTLHLKLQRLPYPAPETEITVKLKDEQWEYRQEVDAGWLDLVIPIELSRPHEFPVLLLSHPTFNIPEEEEMGDPRSLGVLFYALWVTPGETMQAAGIMPRSGDEF